jgi:hypothetical protein
MSRSSTSSSELEPEAPGQAGVDAEGLIEVPEYEPRVWRRWLVGGVLLVNAAGAVGTAVVDNVWPAWAPQPVGLEKQKDDALRAAATWSDGSLASLVERDLRLRSRVRKELSRPYTRALFKLFNEGGARVLVGRKGMLFLKERLDVPDAAPDLGARRAAAEQATHSRRFTALGVEYVTLPVPRKGVVCAELLPPGRTVRPEYDEAVVPAFRDQGVRCVDLLPTFRALEPDEAYLMVDSHWATIGVRAAAEQLALQTGWLKPPEERLGTVVEHAPPKAKPRGDLPLMIGIEFTEADAPKYNRRVVQVIEPRVGVLQAGGEDATVVLCGTSFSNHNIFGSFLSHFLGTRVQNMNLSGGAPTGSLRHMMQQRAAARLPERIVQEIPNHFIHQMATHPGRWAPIAGAGEVFARTLSPVVVRLPVPDGAVVPLAPLGLELNVIGGRELLRIEPGHVAHSGGGVLELEVEGDVAGGTVRFHLHTGGTILDMPAWEGPSGRMSIPLLVDRADAQAASLVAVCTSEPATATVTLRHVAVVSVLDETRALALAASEGPRTSGSRHTSLAVPDRAVERHDTLFLRLAEELGVYSRARLALTSEKGEAVWVFIDLQPGALIAVDIGRHEGTRLTAATLVADVDRTATDAPLVSSAVLYPLARPAH